MRKLVVVLSVGVFALFFLSGCVENSSKYKALQAQLDTLNSVYQSQNTEMEDMFAGLNDVAAGMQSLREAENMLAMEATAEKAGGSQSKQKVAQLKSDITAIQGAIETYKTQITKLEGRNRTQSAEFKKLIAGLNEELEIRSQKISEITAQLGKKDIELAEKSQQIAGLNENVKDLNKESDTQKTTIAVQDQAIHRVNYLVGTKKELKEANVISRQGLFCPPIVSSQAQKGNYTTVDMRELKSIPLNTKKAKVLSVHPSDAYSLEADEAGMLSLKIKDENAFWKTTNYLVVMVN